MDEAPLQTRSFMSATSTKTKEATRVSAFPSVKELFIKSWDVFTASWYKQLALNVVSFFLITLISVVASVVFFALNIRNVSQLNSTPQNFASILSSVPPSVWVSGAVILIVWIVLVWFVSAASLAAQMLIVQAAYKGETVGLREAFALGLRKSLPLFVLYFFTGLLVWGGLWLLFIPGMVISIYLSYSIYMLLLENKGVVESMRESVRIVKANFWALMGRSVVLILILYGIQIVLAIVANQVQNAGMETGLTTVANLVVQFFSQYYAIAYSMVLFNFAREASSNAKSASLKPMVITSVLGWVLGILVLGMVIPLVVKGLNNLPANWMEQIEWQQP